MDKKIIFVVVILLQTIVLGQQRIFVANYNLQNLFDTIDDPDKNDEDFLPGGKYLWTNKKLYKKIGNLARAIRFMNDVQGPDLLGVQEVEHKSLLDTLVKKYFCDKNLKVAYLESPDKRGIDVGLIYNSNLFSVIRKEGLKVELPSKYPTRLILKVDLKMNNGDTVFVFVNHWPSRRGGVVKSAPNRIAAAKVLRTSVDEIQKFHNKANIFILGDFNDEPFNDSITEFLGAKYFKNGEINTFRNNQLINLSASEYKAGKGSFLYKKKWYMLDQIIVSGNLIKNNGIKYLNESFRIIQPYFIKTHNGKYKGAAFPTFGGRRYLGGFSDHFPVGAIFEIEQKK